MHRAKIDFTSIEISQIRRRTMIKLYSFKKSHTKKHESHAVALCYYVKCTHRHAFKDDKCKRNITK